MPTTPSDDSTEQPVKKKPQRQTRKRAATQKKGANSPQVQRVFDFKFDFECLSFDERMQQVRQHIDIRIIGL